IYLFVPGTWLGIAVAVALGLIIYPLVWYTLHRWVLHGRYLYRDRRTAALWKRIHFDHHQDPYDLRVLFGALHTTLPTIALATAPIGWLEQDPYDLRVLFGALHTTLPTIALATAPIGWLVGGPAGACAAFATG